MMMSAVCYDFVYPNVLLFYYILLIAFESEVHVDYHKSRKLVGQFKKRKTNGRLRLNMLKMYAFQSFFGPIIKFTKIK